MAGKWHLLKRRVSTSAGEEMSIRSARQMPFNFLTAFKNAATPTFFSGHSLSGRVRAEQGVKDEMWLWVAGGRGRRRMGRQGGETAVWVKKKERREIH